MKEIVQSPNQVLRDIARDVPLSSIPTKKIQTVLHDMKESLSNQKDGVAIAAPQIGIGLRIFVVHKNAFKKRKSGDEPRDRVFINPVFTKLSKKKLWMEGEGCLSVRWKYGATYRHEKVTLRAYDETGTVFEMSGSGLLSQIFQHEMDHLNGILFIDHAKDINDLPLHERPA